MPVILNLKGDSEEVQESPRESQFKDGYFVSGRGIGSVSGIAKRFKDPALIVFSVFILLKYSLVVFLFTCPTYPDPPPPPIPLSLPI